MNLSTWLSGVRDRLERSTPETRDTAAHKSLIKYDEAEREGRNMIERHFSGFCNGWDAALIASSPTDLALAVEVIEIQAKVLSVISSYDYSGNARSDAWTGMAKEAKIKIDALLKEAEGLR